MGQKTLRFKSKKSYLDWLRYEKWRTSGKRGKHPVKVVIHGKKHRVNHGRKRKR